MIKLVTIIGARPQFIKASALSREIQKQDDIEEIIIHTGQHFDQNMSDIFFEQMDIPKPNYFLNINELNHGAMTGQMLEKIEEILILEKPNWVLVFGDTNSTISGALAAKKLNIKLAHVEAGLRSFNMQMPEEINRILTDRISDILFCPTEKAIKNLNNEGFDKFKCSILNVGDIMQDVAKYYSKKDQKPDIEVPNKFVLATIHRAENTDHPSRIEEIFKALNSIAQKTPVIIPLHPRTAQIIKKTKVNINNLTLINPVGYLEMVYLLKRCCIVMTDSGGLQKEAFFFKKPCITLRDETEWVELVENNYNRIPGANYTKIIESFQNNNFNNNYNLDLYGKGFTSKSIINAIKNYS